MGAVQSAETGSGRGRYISGDVHRKFFCLLLLIKRNIIVPSACYLLNNLCLNKNGMISHVTSLVWANNCMLLVQAGMSPLTV